MISIGIDPGIDGAVGVVRGGEFVAVYDAPTILNGKKRTLHVREMVNLIVECRDHADVSEKVVVTIEKQTAFPGQGVVSMFNLGYGAGLWEGICSTMDLSYSIVRPQAWKARMLNGITTKNKQAGRIIAERLFPDAPLGNRKSEGRADALLIAEYGRRVSCE